MGKPVETDTLCKLLEHWHFLTYQGTPSHKFKYTRSHLYAKNWTLGDVSQEGGTVMVPNCEAGKVS